MVFVARLQEVLNLALHINKSTAISGGELAAHTATEHEQHRAHSDGNNLESVLRRLNALLENHLDEWMHLPQAERVDAALEKLRKL